MSKFVKLPTTTAGKSVLINLDKVLFVEEYANYIVLIFGSKGEDRLTKNIKITMDEFLKLSSDKA